MGFLAPVRPAHAQDSPAYVALGDSLAFGVGADNPAAQGYVGLTEFYLQNSDRFRESGLNLVNLSEPGATSADLVQADGQVDRAIEEIRARADDETEGNEVHLISVDIGGNDLLALAANDSPCIQNTGAQACLDALNQTLLDLQANLSQALEKLRKAAPDAEIFVVNLYNPYSGTESERRLIASVGVQQVNGIIGVVASNPDYDAHLASVFEVFEGRGLQWIASDGIHPNNDGYRAMAEVLEAAIEGRPVSLPPDLLNPPTGTGNGEPAAVKSGDGGVDTIVVLIALPLVFAAGAMLSATYFLVRGRG